MGFEHIKAENSKSLEGSTEYKYNVFDIIVVVDKATESMAGTTENILNELYNNANKSKIMIFYTFFDEFTKKDFEDDKDKKRYLIDLQKTTIKKLGDDSFSTKFAEELSQENRTLFLENLLVPEKNRSVWIMYSKILKNYLRVCMTLRSLMWLIEKEI